MVDEAQSILNNLNTNMSVKDFNEKLIKLFTTIPRKMKKVQDYLANNENEFTTIIKREQDLLDVMRGMVITEDKEDNQDDSDNKDYLASLGLVIEEIDDKDKAIILKSLGESKDKFRNAWRVTNVKTQKAYDKFIKEHNISDTKLLWHGSRNENWWSIINTGLVLRPTNAVITGKMFGYGIYFAPKAKKSIGYTSLRGSYWASGSSDTGYMALMEVAYGNPMNVYTAQSHMDYRKLRASGNYDSLHAHAGKQLYNDEIVVYQQEQVTIKYLVELG